HRFAEITIATVVAQVAGFAVPAILLALAGCGVWSLVIAQLIAGASEALLLFLQARFSFRPQFARRALNDILSFGGSYTFGRLANWGALQIDNIIVGRMLGADA